MRVQIAARHCDVPESARVRVDEQMRKLSKYDPRVSAADIVFQVEKHTKKVEGILSVDRDEPMVASGHGDEFRTAIDQMADRLARMLRRRRSQIRDHQGPRISETEKAAAD
jgi:ribosomal subunit interface protein